MIGVYIHIPFCRTICPYCDFVKRPIKGAAPSAFVDALCGEIESFDGPNDVHSVFFGGGTPSLLDPVDLGRVLDTLQRRFNIENAEINLEANPDDVTPALVDSWKALGINRVSLGVQSFDDGVLQYLGRRHDASGAHGACDIVAERFERWSLDLMFGAHPIGPWPETLRQVIAHAPPHVSAYGLTYESGTPFGKRSHEAVDDDQYLTLYHETVSALGKIGLYRYEVSNFAKPGQECLHNLIYWRNEAYAGFGTGAYSFIDGVRARNHENTEDYMKDPGGKCERLALSRAEQQVETVIQYLRLGTGLDVADYHARFGSSVLEDFGPALRGLEARGLISIGPDRIVPTGQGFDLNNEIGLALVATAAT